MSVTNDQLKFILDHIFNFLPKEDSKLKLVKFFVKDQRKKWGPRIDVFLIDKKNNLLVRDVEFISVKKDDLRFKAWNLYLINPVKERFVLLESSRNQYIDSKCINREDNFHPYMIYPDKDVEKAEFIAAFFKVPFIKERDLSKEEEEKMQIKCIKCGKCCTFYKEVPITDEDIKRWKRLKRKDILCSIFYHYQKPKLSLREVDGHCKFFIDGECSIHRIKPENCKRWPIFHSNRKSVGCGAYLLHEKNKTGDKIAETVN